MKRIITGVCLLLIGTVVVIVWWIRPSRPEAPGAVQPPTTKTEAHGAAPTPAPANVVAGVPAPAIVLPDLASRGNAAIQSLEVRATHQMVLAHSSLRAPEVADLDSSMNRQVLQTMITKARTRSSPAPERPLQRP